MNVILYSNSGDLRQLNKNLTHIANVTAELTDSVSVTDPALKLVLNNNVLSANYFYIPAWNAYYYYSKKPDIEGGTVIIYGSIDRLQTFKNQILNSYVIAARSSSHPEPFIPDTVCSDKGTVRYITRRSANTPFGSGSYILNIAGR